METTGTIEQISTDFKNNQTILTLKLNSNELMSLEKLKDSKVNIEVKKWYQKRKLDCNAYMWLLIQKIAEKISTPDTVVRKEDIYRDAIKEVGAYQIVPIKNDAVEEWIRVWQTNGIGWVCDTQPSKLEGFTNVMCYHGSSVYNQKEMNRLVDIIKEECRNLEIETMPPDELDALLKEWSK